MFKADHDPYASLEVSDPTSPQEELAAENVSLRLLLTQAKLSAETLLAQAGIDAKEREALLKRAFSNPWDWRDRGRDTRDIRPGFFKVQAVFNGPWLPACIWRPCPIEFHDDGAWQWLDRWHRLECRRHCICICRHSFRPFTSCHRNDARWCHL